METLGRIRGTEGIRGVKVVYTIVLHNAIHIELNYSVPIIIHKKENYPGFSIHYTETRGTQVVRSPLQPPN